MSYLLSSPDQHFDLSVDYFVYPCSCARRFCASRFCVRRHNRGLVRFVTRLAMAGRHWQQWVPIVPAMKGYQREDFCQDLAAGVVVGMVTVPWPWLTPILQAYHHKQASTHAYYPC